MLEKQKEKTLRRKKRVSSVSAMVFSLVNACYLVSQSFELWLKLQDVYSYTYDQLFTTDPQVKNNFTITTNFAGFHVNYYKELIFGDLVPTPAPPT